MRIMSDEPIQQERLDIRAAYDAETERTIRRRLELTAALFMLVVGTSGVLEVMFHPERQRLIVIIYAIETLLIVAGLITCRIPRVRRPRVVAAVLMSALSLAITSYALAVRGEVERVASGQVCLLTGLVVLLPWSWRSQLAVAAATFAGLAAAALSVPFDEHVAYAILSTLTGASVSVVGALFLDRYRLDAFVRSALHQEEAEIAASLVRVGESLSAHLEQPDMLERVTALAMEAVGCDWSSIFVWNESRQAYRLGANAGSRPDIRAELGELEFRAGSMPLVSAFRPGEMIEMPDSAAQSLVPVELQRRLEVASALYVPICRSNRVRGVLVCGYRQRTGSFSMKQRRLARGIANAAAVAFENARLIGDLQAASRLKTEFVSTMSHELRTPLNVITGYTDLLIDGAFGDLTSAQHDSVVRIRRSSVELFEMVSATLDVGRLESGRDPVMIGPIDVNDLLGELVREVESLVPTPVDLRIHNGVGADTVLSDRVKLKTILKNLLSNALKFTSEGCVDVRVGHDGRVLRLQVEDTGIGIADEDIPVIFDMFRQLDGSLTRRFGGVGLGLHIVQRLVALLGGQVDVKSAPGRGSTFTVTVPVGLVTNRRATGS